MNKGLKILLGAGAAIGLFFAGKKLMALKDVNDFLETKIINPKVKNITLSGILFTCNVEIKNPTSEELIITQPFVRLLAAENKVLATSNVSNTTTKILPKSITPRLANDISIQLAWTSLLPYANDVLKVSGAILKNWTKGDNEGVKKSLSSITPMFMQYHTRINDSFDYSSSLEKIL